MNLKVYTSMSVLAAAIVVGTGYTASLQNYEKELLKRKPTDPALDKSMLLATGVVHYILRSKFNILVMVNMAYNLLFLFGKLIQWIFFGKLRPTEYKNINERLLNYILIKVLFIGAMMEPDFTDLVVWTAWFSILGFMKIFSLLARDRFEYLTTFNPNTAMSVHAKLLVLLVSILLFDIGWFYFVFTVFQQAGYSVLLLLTFECFTLLLDTIQTLIKYTIHLVDLSKEGVWEQRGTYIYYTEFCTDTLILAATLGHYIQILILHGVSFTFIDAILFLNMRVVFNNLREKIVAYKNYRELARNMKNRYPDVTAEELQTLDDVCAICHDKMEAAKKLPCNHIFHHSCLRSWLEKSHNCPTCRYALIATPSGPAGPAQVNQPNPIPPNLRNDTGAGIGRENVNEVFRFNGNQWFSWLPSVQVVHGRRGFIPMQPAMIPQEYISRVQEVFPEISPQVIAQDLMHTRSVELTIENFLEGRIPTPVNVPPPQQNINLNPNRPTTPAPRQQPSPTPSTPTTPTPIRTEPVSPPVTTSTTTTTTSNVVSPELPKLADTFAGTPQERQQRLQQRKQQMLELARKQFLEKQQQPATPSIVPQEKPSPVISEERNEKPDFTFASNETPTSSPSLSSSHVFRTNSTESNEVDADTIDRRRRLMLEAAQRRQESKKDL